MNKTKQGTEELQTPIPRPKLAVEGCTVISKRRFEINLGKKTNMNELKTNMNEKQT